MRHILHGVALRTGSLGSLGSHSNLQDQEHELIILDEVKVSNSPPAEIRNLCILKVPIKISSAAHDQN